MSQASSPGMRFLYQEQRRESPLEHTIEVQLSEDIWERPDPGRKILGAVPALPSHRNSDSYSTSTSFSNNSTEVHTYCTRRPSRLTVDWEELGIPDDELPEKVAWREIYLKGAQGIAEPTLTLDQLSAEDREAFEDKLNKDNTNSTDPDNPSKRYLRKQTRIATKKANRRAAIENSRVEGRTSGFTGQNTDAAPHCDSEAHIGGADSNDHLSHTLMTSDSSKSASDSKPEPLPAQHRPLVVGLTKPPGQFNTMASSEAAAALNKEIEKNVQVNTKEAGPAEESATTESAQPKQKKEKAPKQPKPQKAPAPSAPTSPSLIDLRVGHILRAIAHPNADSLYVSTIAMGDPEGTEHTQVDEETGKVVRTVCSGLNGLIPLAEMQNRKIIVVANLKPVNMRSIKSAAMVLAASPQQEEGADPHAADRVVELVIPPENSDAGDKVYFEGWPYGDGKGPEKQLNPKKKQWEAVQPGFYTSDDLVVGFDASKCDEVQGNEKGNLVVEGKGICKVKTLKGAAVR